MSHRMWHLVLSRRVWNSHGLAIESELHSQHVQYSMDITDSVDQVAEVVTRKAGEGVTRWVAVGGDGAVHWMVNAIMGLDDSVRADHTLGILPLGTGCDFARVAQIPGDLEMAISILQSGEATAIDVGTIEGEWGRRYFINVADIGIAAVAAHRAEQLRGLGQLRYLAALWMSLPSARRSEMQIQSDSDEITAKCLAIILANGRYFGGGFEVAPNAELRDGQIDMLVAKSAWWNLPRLLRDVIRRTHLQRPDIVSAKVRTVQITGAALTVEADGEHLGNTPAKVKILPAAIKVQLPNHRNTDAEPL
ncbi:MAG: YegS/Rv2252/BmrU family lipid kinase [Planctomycetota bacterium]